MSTNTITLLDGREAHVGKCVKYIKAAAHFSTKKRKKEFEKFLDLLRPDDMQMLSNLAFPSTAMQQQIQKFKQRHR